MIGRQKKPLQLQIFVNLIGTLGYCLYSIAKPGGNILNQRILIYEKRNIEFMLTENKFMLKENSVTNCLQLKLKIYE